MKILLDTNIALDVLLERHPFHETGTKVLGLSKGGVELFISASAITDIYYIARKRQTGKEAAMNMLKTILLSADVASVTGNEIRRAIALDWNDFEDAVQYAAGERIEVDYVVTRNAADFAFAAIPVVSPEVLLAIIVSGQHS
jgi:predicted nucleic acid-binding protein